MSKPMAARARLIAIACAMALSAQAMADATKSVDIPAGDLRQALLQVSQQFGTDLVYSPEQIQGVKTRGAHGQLSPEQAISRLLEGTSLELRIDPSGAVLIAPPATSAEEDSRAPASAAGRPQSSGPLPRLAQADPSGTNDQDERQRDSASEAERSGESEAAASRGIPEVLVQGSKSLNVDIARTEDDPQPYVVFDREQMERSGATSLEQFLQQRLPMNTSIAGMGGAADVQGISPSSSGINLRGLGSAQTLILVDGHRMSSPSVRGATTQGEISGIPLAAVERIEILPSTASGIYGGSATGGVINIITRKDFSGGEVRLTYDNTFNTDSAIRKIDFVLGHNFNEGRTNILLSAGYSDANPLTEADRHLFSRGRAHMRRYNPDYYLTEVPGGRLPNFASVDGSDLVLKSGAELGSPYASVPTGYAGVDTDGGAALATNAGQHDWSLSDGVSGLGRVLYTEPTLKSAGLVLRHRFTDGLQGFVDLVTSESRRRHLEVPGVGGVPFTLEADSPYNPFTTAIRGVVPVDVQTPNQSSTDRDRAVIGVIKQLPAAWQMSLDYTWDRTQLDFVAAPTFTSIVYGGVDVLRDVQAFPLDIAEPAPTVVSSMQSIMKDANLRLSGPLGNLPGGRPVLSAALAHREEAAPSSLWDWREDDFMLLFPARSTSVSSAYMEYRIPLFSRQNARPGLRELELQVAARYEKYASRSGEQMGFVGGLPSPLPESIDARNEFSSVDPTIALRWKPAEALTFRMSYGTGFLPPNLDQLAPTVFTRVGSFLSDPRRGNSALGVFTYAFGGNPDLQPESSRSWSAGLIFTPSRLPDLRAAVDYTRIEKRDNIGGIPGFWQGLIDQEAVFPGRVVRGPNLPGDPAGWAGPITHLDLSPANLSRLELEAWDVQLDYRLDTEARGAFELFLVGTWQPRYAIQTLSGQPMVDYVGLGAVNPLEIKANAGLTWSLSAWRAGWNLNYFGSYEVSPDITLDDIRVMANQGNGGRVPSQTYHDVFVNYDFSMSHGSSVPDWLSGTRVQFGIRNLFNKRPPVDMAAEYGYAYYSPFGSPRLASYYLTVTTQF